jgi:epoxyqueuosine reductase
MEAMKSAADTLWIGERAAGLGFELCGVAPAERFPELAQTEEWLARGYAGEMNYLADPRRADPELALPGVRSVIVCGLNYNTPHAKSIDVADENSEDAEPRGWISRYAWGSDYHQVLWSKLNELAAALRERFQEPFEARPYSDTGPIQERVFAKHAGLGWLGKNTLVLNQQMGSWFFLGAILTTLDLAPSLAPSEAPPPDLCGSCTRCIDACPTSAFVEPYVMDASRCIAYLTIELRGSIPENFRKAIGHHVFGCDICQDVCPWNRKAPQTQELEFQPRAFASQADESLYHPRLEWLASMTEDEFKAVFRNSPIKRTKWRGLVRNACIALGNAKHVPGARASGKIRALLQRLSSSTDPAISESALWALSRIQ